MTHTHIDQQASYLFFRCTHLRESDQKRVLCGRARNSDIKKRVLCGRARNSYTKRQERTNDKQPFRERVKLYTILTPTACIFRRV